MDYIWDMVWLPMITMIIYCACYGLPMTNQQFNRRYSLLHQTLVKFEDEYYDLRGFDHPGGNDIIGMLNTRDVTALIK